ncbi:MAG: neocarzinostatin apoprotein domain-containing protein [Acidimicrobiales bacterium]
MRASRTKLAATLAVLAGIAFLPAAAVAAPADPEQVVVTPSTGLVDGQTVQVSFSGFTAEVPVLIRQCLPNPLAGEACDFETLVDTVTDADGAGSFPFTLRTSDGSLGLPCDAANPCTIAVSRFFSDFNSDAAFAPISFAKTPTRLKAAPALARLLPSIRIHFPNVAARLTEANANVALAGRTINFSVAGRAICSSTTNTNGRASCAGSVPASVAVLANLGYRADFAGGPYHDPATATAGLFFGR